MEIMMLHIGHNPNSVSVLKQTKKMLRELFIPQYLWRERHLKSAKVLNRISWVNALGRGIGLGYFLEVQFDHHRDMQSIYPTWWKTRKGYVRISRQLYKERFLFDVDIWCQYNRHFNGERDVRLRMAS